MYRYLIIFRWSQVLQKSLNFGKQPVIDCPVAKWSTPKPSNETFIESKWKHRPLLAIDLDDISIIEPQAGPVRLNRDIQVINICICYICKFSICMRGHSMESIHTVATSGPQPPALEWHLTRLQ